MLFLWRMAAVTMFERLTAAAAGDADSATNETIPYIKLSGQIWG